LERDKRESTLTRVLRRYLLTRN